MSLIPLRCTVIDQNWILPSSNLDLFELSLLEVIICMYDRAVGLLMIEGMHGVLYAFNLGLELSAR
jgi:hypothetical protein